MGLLGSIAGGFLGIGSSAIQNSQNRQNVRETNQMNYRINQMNNQFNERMAMQQRDFQEKAVYAGETMSSFQINTIVQTTFSKNENIVSDFQ
jgi:hypothetical protein